MSSIPDLPSHNQESRPPTPDPTYASSDPGLHDLSAEQILPELRTQSQEPQKALAPSLREEYEAKWREIGTQVTQFRDGLGMGMDINIIPAVHALRALDFPTAMSCEGHIDRPNPFPLVIVAEPGARFQFRYIGQEELFRELLVEIPIPWELRVSNYSVIGRSHLTPEILEQIDSPRFRVEHKELNDAVSAAFMKAISTPRSGDDDQNYTPAGRKERERELELKSKLQALIDEFNSGRCDREEARMHIAPLRGITIIKAGIQVSDEASSAELLRERQDVMSEFAGFLKGKFFLR